MLKNILSIVVLIASCFMVHTYRFELASTYMINSLNINLETYYLELELEELQKSIAHQHLSIARLQKQ
ncbi:MAG: hypothetical protein OCC49_16080 [Fibrobacterales bacterium]